MKRPLRILIALAAIVLAFLTTVAGAWLLSAFWNGGRSNAAEEHLVHHLASLRADSDFLINSAARADHAVKIGTSTLPQSLRVPGLSYALVHRDHITLITYHSPDTDSGFRIWKSAMPKDFVDEPTSISFVTRFRYCDDYPESSSNRLE